MLGLSSGWIRERGREQVPFLAAAAAAAAIAAEYTDDH